MSVTESQVAIRIQFLDYLFGDSKGFLCIATASNSKVDFKQNFFEWPAQRSIAANFIDQQQKTKNVWFCVNLLSQPERKKEYCMPSTFAWADLDYVIPKENGDSPYPTCIVESSPSRFQAYWRISGESVPPDVAEDFSHKLAYKLGADKSGWDLTQLLRIPWTQNFKYNPPEKTELKWISEIAYDASLFDSIQVAEVTGDDEESSGNLPMPENLPSIDNIFYKFKAEGKMDEEFTRLFSIEPDRSADWSKILWRFIHKSFEIGLTAEEVLVVSNQASCNKYRRDNRPMSYLWRDVNKAAQEHKRFALLVSNKVEIVTMPHLVDFDEFEEDTFIKDYKDWAGQATDAPEQYHELSCFIALSSVICSGLWLPVNQGEIVPNLWALMLGESSLTRKTTSMRLAMDIIKDIDESLILATTMGSAEGLLTGLSGRPKQVSIFWKDEVTGFFDSINRKDYLADLPETLTQLYDVPKVLTRLLRKETITISEPYFIFFGGGIRDKVYSLINENYILSGFLPRFLVVSGENDLSRFRRMGPPSEFSSEKKSNIVRSLSDLKDRYNATVKAKIGDQEIDWPTRIEARLTPEAWQFYGDIEEVLVKAGSESDMSMMALPTFTRLAISLLKMSLLIAASRREPDSSNHLNVEIQDVKQAAFYIERWGHYSIDLLLNAGKTQSEKIIGRALGLIKRKEGIPKGELMQRMHLSARESKDLIDTMDQRGLISVKRAGNGLRLYSV